MTKKSRRRLLQGIALTLPATWTRPVVDTIVLPAHAQTSGGCSASAGCYEITGVDGGPDFEASFQWPGGGAGPYLLELIPNITCDGPGTPGHFGLARNEQEALDLMPCTRAGLRGLDTNPAVPGCRFFFCPPDPGDPVFID